MKTYMLQRRLAAKLLGVGKNRVWLSQLRLNEIGDAITKVDVKGLIKEGAIKKLPVVGVKRRAGKMRQLQKKKRGRTTGRKRRVVKKTKKQYIQRVRKLRNHVHILKRQSLINMKQYKLFRKDIKSGAVRTKQDINIQLKK
jgi:large subunit ribosomal protein L19e